MKRNFARQVLIARLASLALSALGFLHLVQVPVRAQEMTSYIVVFPSVGLAEGQRMRLTLFNPEGAPVRAQAQLRHVSGGIQAGMADGSVRFISHGISQSFDINRADIPLAGEPGTGRLQLRASISFVRLDVLEASNPVVASMEIVEISDGTSNTIMIGEVKPSIPNGGAGTDVLVGGAGRDTLMGFVPHQTLRVTLFDTGASGSDYPPSRIKLFDARGIEIAQSPDLVVPPGAFRSFDFDRNSLPIAGERSTGRLQVRVKVETADDPYSFTTDPRASGQFAVSFELIDNTTGRTRVMCQNNLKQLTLASH